MAFLRRLHQPINSIPPVSEGGDGLLAAPTWAVSKKGTHSSAATPWWKSPLVNQELDAT